MGTAFRHPAADPAEVAVTVRWYRQIHRDAIAKEPVEGDFRVVLGEKVELELKELGDALVAGEADEQHSILPEGGADYEGPVGLEICRHHRHSIGTASN